MSDKRIVLDWRVIEKAYNEIQAKKCSSYALLPGSYSFIEEPEKVDCEHEWREMKQPHMRYSKCWKIKCMEPEDIKPEWEKKFDKALLGEWDKFLLHIKSKNFIREEVLGKLKEELLNYADHGHDLSDSGIDDVFKQWGVDV